MADHKQAKKRIRQTAKINAHKRTLRSKLRTFIKKLETAIEAGDKKAVGPAFTTAMSELHKGVTKGILKKQTASRKISRLAARVKGMNS